MTLVLLLGRIAVLRAWMRPTVTDEVARSVCRSVCHNREPCKNGWTNRSRCLGCWMGWTSGSMC